VEPLEHDAGQLLVDQGGVAMSPAPGTIDASLHGARSPGLTGSGGAASITFRRIRPGDHGIDFKSVTARNVANEDIPVHTQLVATVPAVTTLSAPSPNPFGASTTFAVALAQAGPVELAIFSVDGRRVRTLIQGIREVGEQRIPWDGRDELGQSSPAGVYYVRLTTDRGEFCRRVVRLH
jgi:hypothetical protein